MFKWYQFNFILAVMILALVGMQNCKSNQKPEDTKEVAKEHNDAKFNDADKEKDAKFLVNAAEINLKEISLGKLAQQISNTSDVKFLGKEMEEAHSKSLNDLSALAKQKTITIPISITDDTKGEYKKLAEKDRRVFDKEYCDMMVNGHKEAIALFEKASMESSDVDIKMWATNLLPDLRTHLVMR